MFATHLLRSRWITWCCLAVIGGMIGCSPKLDRTPASVAIKGRLVKDGKPIEIASAASAAGWVEIKLYPLDAAGVLGTQSIDLGVNADGTFSKASSTDGTGLPSGKYRIVVRAWDPYPNVDKLNGQFDEQNSKITREITGPIEINLDLAKPE